ncbi:hypothetical protein GC173_06270 [bacterium]|nr:hypothetical protein [bacterium]
MNAEAMLSPCRVLPTGVLVPQEEVQATLAEFRESGGSLDGTMLELAAWEQSVGYFNHITDQNEYLTFPDSEYGLTFRLQINYSRLAYKAPDGPRLACPLCFENIGIPGKTALRVFELNLGESRYFTHLTPFPLHPNHFVLNLREHEPMEMSIRRLREIALFLRTMPRWLAASNSDVAWAGASVLGHHHVQLFRDLRLPLEEARIATPVAAPEGLTAAMLHWPCPVLRLEGPSHQLLEAAARIIPAWKDHQPGACTFNYLLRAPRADRLELHLIFRHPDFRTPTELQPIKSEGVGVVEMAGEIIVPPLAELDRTRNRNCFQKAGPRVIRGIIGGNAPKAPRFAAASLVELSAHALSEK